VKQHTNGQPPVCKQTDFGLPIHQNGPPLRLFREVIDSSYRSYLKLYPAHNVKVPTRITRNVKNGS